MGAIADAIAEYTKPLLDKTDGSLEQVQKAFDLGQVCWNFALLPADQRDEAVRNMQPLLQMDDEEFESFRSTLILPMIRRHEEMFPLMHGRGAMDRAPVPPQLRANMPPPPRDTIRRTPTPTDRFAGTKPNAPCPCQSGRKYKRCCGR